VWRLFALKDEAASFAFAVDDASAASAFRRDDEHLAFEVDVPVCVAGIDSALHPDDIAVGCGVDCGLNRGEISRHPKFAGNGGTGTDRQACKHYDTFHGEPPVRQNESRHHQISYDDNTLEARCQVPSDFFWIVRRWWGKAVCIGAC